MNEKGLCNINGVPDFVLAHNKLSYFFVFFFVLFFVFFFLCFTDTHVTFSDGIMD